MPTAIFDFGSSPHKEESVPVGAENYRERAMKECSALVGQIRRQFGEPPAGVTLKVKSSKHELGSYLEVVAMYDDLNDEHKEYVYKVEAELADRWDAEAKAELGLG